MHLIQTTTTTSVLLLSLLSTNRAMAFGTSNKISAGVGDRGLRGAGGGGRSYNDDFEPPEDGVGDRGLRGAGGGGRSYNDDFEPPEDQHGDQTAVGVDGRGLRGGDGRPYAHDDFVSSYQQHPEDHASDQTLDAGVGDRGLTGPPN